MGVVFEKHFVIGEVPAGSLRELARRHRPRVSNPWALKFLSALEQADVDGLWVWGSGGKGLDVDFDEAIEPLVADLVALFPRARAVRSQESDHDDHEDGATWSELHRSGDEEGPTERPSWQTVQLGCRLGWFRRDDEDEDEDVDTTLPGAPVDKPTWSLRSGHVYAVMWNDYLEDDGRNALLDRVRSVMSRAEDPSVRACMQRFCDVLESWDTSSSCAFPAWCHASTSIDVQPLVRALGALNTLAAIGYQPEGDTMKIVSILGPEAITHHDLPLGFSWSPSLVSLVPTGAQAAGDPPATAPTELSIPESPHAAAVLSELEGLDIIGLKDKPVFQRLASLTIAERRHLVLALGARTAGARNDQIEALLYLLVDKSEIAESHDDLVELLGAERVLGVMACDALVLLIERFTERTEPSEALKAAIVASDAIRNRAALAPRKPDKRKQKELPYPALRLLQRARGAPPFPIDAWGERLQRDLSGLPKTAQRAWRELFAAWDKAPLPFVVPAAWLTRFDESLRAIGREAATATAREWLVALGASEAPLLPAEDDRILRNLQICDALAIVGAEPSDGAGPVFSALAEAALRPSRAGGCRSPRLAYRAIDLLHRAGERDELRSLSADAPFTSVRDYAARRAAE